MILMDVGDSNGSVCRLYVIQEVSCMQNQTSVMLCIALIIDLHTVYQNVIVVHFSRTRLMLFPVCPRLCQFSRM